MKTKQFPFWVLSISVMIGLTLPLLIQDGMFMDALLYSCVSHNLATGDGTFWFPYLSPVGIAGTPTFHEHPPLVFGIQAIFFKVFGSSMYVERLYTFLAMLVTAFFIHKLWKYVFSDQPQLKNSAWLPIFLWITLTLTFWSFSHNMQENTMGVFVLSAVFFSYKAMKTLASGIGYTLLAGVFIFAAALSKGVPGFFPLAVPFVYWLSFKNGRFLKMATHTAITLVTVLILFLLVLQIPEAKASLTYYFHERLLQRIHTAPTVDSRFWILFRLFQEIVPLFVFVGIFWAIATKKKIELKWAENKENVMFFILIGLSGSAPLMLTLVQRGFYFVPALPFFAIASAIIIAPVIVVLISRIDVKKTGFKVFRYFAYILFISVLVISISKIGKASRDKDILHDVEQIGRVLDEKSIITVPKKYWEMWNLQFYLLRYHKIYFDQKDGHPYKLMAKGAKNTDVRFEKIPLNTLTVDIYRQKN